MADEDPLKGLSWALTGRFEGIDDRLGAHDRKFDQINRDMNAMGEEIGKVKEENAVVAEALTNLSESWKALRTALYTFSVLIVGAAVTLIIIGKPL